MSDYPYEPPQREFQDTLLAFKDFEMASTWSVRVEADPLGPFNKIVTLMHGQKRVRSALCRVPVGASVRLVRDEGGYSMNDLFAMKDLIWESRGQYAPNITSARIPFHVAGWRVEVNDEAVLAVSDAEMRPPYVAPPGPPLWKRMRTVLNEQVRADADWIAARLGYHREDHCDNYGDW